MRNMSEEEYGYAAEAEAQAQAEVQYAEYLGWLLKNGESALFAAYVALDWINSKEFADSRLTAKQFIYEKKITLEKILSDKQKAKKDQMNLTELKYVELSGKIVLLEEKNKELFKRWDECKHIFDINEMKIINERVQLKAELKAIENQLNVTNQIEEVKW